jgi:hypothetical protein
MSWTDFYRRRDICDEVLRRAARAPRDPLPFTEVRDARQVFGSEEQLLLALQYKWTQLLSGYVRTELTGDTDQVDAVSRAWHRAVRSHRTLREVLDANLDRHPALRLRHEAEQRMLAISAGLADPDEQPGEVTKVGAAFRALLRHGPDAAPAEPRDPVRHLLRMLTPDGRPARQTLDWDVSPR